MPNDPDPKPAELSEETLVEWLSEKISTSQPKFKIKSLIDALRAARQELTQAKDWALQREIFLGGHITELGRQLANEKEGGRLMCIQHAQAMSQKLAVERQSQHDQERIAELEKALEGMLNVMQFPEWEELLPNAEMEARAALAKEPSLEKEPK